MVKHEKKPAEAPEPPETALGGMLRARGFEATPPPPAQKPNPESIDLAKSGKIVVRRERKGRGGKTVTVVSGIERPPAELERIAKAMRKALGCGSTVEGPAIILQGDIVPRAQAWLQSHGATRIVLGS
ncbi:MAG: translation initiation factor [Armatimonadota bacterium]